MMSNLKVLIADDSPSDRLLLEALVRKAGYEVLPAEDGVEALEVFNREAPDIVLLDALMPRMDGFEVARAIKSVDSDDMTPIIFLTSLVDTESLVKCLDAGGDDFLSKPYNGVILQAKIRAMVRLREMHQTLQSHRDKIAKNHQQLLREQVVAKEVFDNIAHTGCLGASNVKYSLSPLAVFNGDVIVAGMRPNNSMVLLLGDFTGHGLPASIGAMPLASSFYGMIQKGFSPNHILREINQKLHQILPTGLFCCAAIAEINFKRRTAQVWNGGLPGVLMQRADGTVDEINSKHLPLGVVGDERFQGDMVSIDMAVGDRLFLWSDGVIEARNQQGEMFGQDRLIDCFKQNATGTFDSVLNAVQDFADSEDQDDDISLLQVEMVEQDVLSGITENYQSRTYNGLSDWSFSMELNPANLTSFDPLPLLVNILVEVPNLRDHSGELYTILAELYSNALEHGLLGLSSDLKSSREGFADYYREREDRLQNLKDGWIRFNLTSRHTNSGGQLSIEIEDSGKGFDVSLLKDNSSNQYSGRGIGLVSRLCHSIQYENRGSKAVVIFEWER